MAAIWTFYDAFKLAQFNGNAIDFDTDDIKIMLLDDTHVLGRATHDFVDDVAADEISGTNYARKSLTNVTLTVTANTLKFDADDPTTYPQSASGFSNARHAVLFKDAGGLDSANRLIAFATFDANVGNVSGDLDLAFDATNGIFTV
jgi:hypothetical protein